MQVARVDSEAEGVHHVDHDGRGLFAFLVVIAGGGGGGGVHVHVVLLVGKGVVQGGGVHAGGGVAWKVEKAFLEPIVIL